MKFIPVILSLPQKTEDESTFVKQLFEAGLSYFHWRKPEISWEESDAFLKQFPKKMQEKIVLHQHHSLVEKFPDVKIHLKECDKKNKMLYKDVHSMAIHNLQEIKDLDVAATYVFLSPVFDSYSKPHLKSGFSSQILSEFFAKKTSEIAVFALGGIDEKNIKKAKEIGFQGAGMIGSIWDTFLHEGSTKALEKFSIIQEICNE